MEKEEFLCNAENIKDYCGRKARRKKGMGCTLSGSSPRLSRLMEYVLFNRVYNGCIEVNESI